MGWQWGHLAACSVSHSDRSPNELSLERLFLTTLPTLALLITLFPLPLLHFHGI